MYQTNYSNFTGDNNLSLIQGCTCKIANVNAMATFVQNSSIRNEKVKSRDSKCNLSLVRMILKGVLSSILANLRNTFTCVLSKF